MRAVVVYESMFGNTRRVAEAIGRGVASEAEVTIVPVSRVDASVVQGADLLVVGGPTHVHSMSRARTRAAAAGMARTPESGLILDADAEGQGVREWCAALPTAKADTVTFDSPGRGPALFTGRASTRIARVLRRNGYRVLARPESFLVSGKDTHLEPGEEARAEQWARGLVVHAA